MDTDYRRRRVTTDRRPASSLSTTDDVSSFIAQSWQRSRQAGVVPDGSNPPRLQFVEDLDLRRRLVQCASPILDRLHDDLSGMSLSVALTDEHAQVMLRRDNDPALAAKLDGVCFAPGFNYSEDVIGTNGVGTASKPGWPSTSTGANTSTRQFTISAAPAHLSTIRFSGVSKADRHHRSRPRGEPPDASARARSCPGHRIRTPFDGIGEATARTGRVSGSLSAAAGRGVLTELRCLHVELHRLSPARSDR